MVNRGAMVVPGTIEAWRGLCFLQPVMRLRTPRQSTGLFGGQFERVWDVASVPTGPFCCEWLRLRSTATGASSPILVTGCPAEVLPCTLT